MRMVFTISWCGHLLEVDGVFSPGRKETRINPKEPAEFEVLFVKDAQTDGTVQADLTGMLECLCVTYTTHKFHGERETTHTPALEDIANAALDTILREGYNGG